jgi:hypothetical protein
MQASENQSSEEFKKSITDSFNIANELADYVVGIQKSSIEINKVFVQGRLRVSELMSSIADAVPMVNRLGGSMADVSKTMSEIAIASNRNVIANTKDVEKLFAAQKILGQSAGELTNSFLDVGVGLNKIPEQLEESIGYIQSIGGNAKEVMKDVTDNMSQMNRFQFNDGIAGLTKMAAQAAMLRFNMGETFRLADKVLDPEGAIEVASAFQRLGLSAGALVDPFQLMNMSINDPSGLQDSLADVAKQFTYFDEQTQTFKINPQGVLTLKEMEKQTGVSAAEMSKMGLAAAELDQRLSAVNMAGLTIASEEDKQYLANIATMQDGKYKVTLEDGTKKELADLQQKDFDKLIDAEKNRPKNLEEIARTQMNISETIRGDVSAIKTAFLGGVTTAKPIKETIIGAQRTADVLGGEASKKFGTTESARVEVETALKDLGTMAMDFKEGVKVPTQTLSDYLMKVGNQLESIQNKFTDALKEYGKNVYDKMSDKTIGESLIKNDIIGNVLDNTKTDAISNNLQSKNLTQITNNNTSNITSNQMSSSKIDISGTIKHDFSGIPAGVSTSQVAQQIDKSFNSQSFQDFIYRLSNQDSSKKPVSSSFLA